MNGQLEEIATELREATDRLHRLRNAVPADQWTVRNDPARWSVSECIAHLNLTSAAFEPLLADGIERARKESASSRKYRRGFLGWALWKMTGPDSRGRVQTAAAFVPASAPPAAEVSAEFERRQGALLALLASADGLPIDKVTMTSPFNARMRYNIYAGFSAIPRHQHRHLQQAERVWAPAR
ncbi:MAG TPA: DinB family protein [Gemmatimonadales bacterium]|nr:DinB family protein [Gemmatimonadales bacterium]